jgi:hypothetical protein
MLKFRAACLTLAVLCYSAGIVRYNLHPVRVFSFDKIHNHTVPSSSSLDSQAMSSKEPLGVARRELEKSAEEPLQCSIGDSDPNVILVDYEVNDPENPLNWSSLRKWLTVLAISWMGFVR